MVELVEWLRAQLDKDERDAKARRGIFPSPGVSDDGSVTLHVRPGGNMTITWYRHPAEGWDDMAKLQSWADTEHGWTQERVLREIDAKRRTVALCEPPLVDATGPQDTKRHFVPGEGPPWGLDVLKLLALPYADRPGYREEWRP